MPSWFSKWFGRQTQRGDRPPVDQPRRFFRACNIYCRPESDQVVVAAVFNHGGPTAEKPGGAAVASLSDATVLTEMVRSALAQCEYQEEFNYSQKKKSDWPAYQASGCKTMKQFEADYIRLYVRGVNDANLYYDVVAPEFGEFGLHLTVTVHAGGSANYGEAVQYIVEHYLACKSAIENGAHR